MALDIANLLCHQNQWWVTNMYFTQLPDHNAPGFDEQLHFSKFKKHNIVFNVLSSGCYCSNHVGCLSVKTVFGGEEWYGVNNQRLALRPGQFLVLNDAQNYSCRSDNGEKLRSLSFFFKKEFATSVFNDALQNEEASLDNPFDPVGKTLEFFQALHIIDAGLRQQLLLIVSSLETKGYDSCMMDEHLVFLLLRLIRVYKSESTLIQNVAAVKPATRTEIYKRLCVARDILHSSFHNSPDLQTLGNMACLSVPQLVRQFKFVFKATPHQYLTMVRLNHAAGLLKQTGKPVHEITWLCGFYNVSAFCRAFKSAYGLPPASFRKMC